MDYYASSLDHILAEFQRLDLFIRAQVWRARRLHQDEQEGLARFYIDEAEVDGLLEKAVGSPPWAEIPLPQELQRSLQDTLDRMAADLERRAAASRRQGIELRLIQLAQCFGLSVFDVDVILVALAPALDRRYERLYAYLHDDVTRKHPTVDLVLNLLCPQWDARLAARARFAPDAPLRHHGLIQLFEDPGFRQASLLGQQLQLDPRITDYLLDGNALDERLQPYAQHVAAGHDPDPLIGPADLKARLLHVITAGTDDNPAFYLQGDDGAGRQAMAQALCKELDMGLISVDTRRLAAAKAEDFESLVRLAHREALLHQAAVYWDEFDCLLDDDQRTRREEVLRALIGHPGLIFLAGNTAWEPSTLHRARKFLRIEFPRPTVDDRLRIWNALLPDHSLDLKAVAGKFRFGGGQIRAAAATARSLAHWRDPDANRINDADLHAACRLQSNRKLSKLAQAITPHYAWDDIVLPPEQTEQLRAICHQVNYRDLVYDTWGFDRKLALGKGINVLFAGPPGTGKTMAADIMAHELGLDLYKIDLSTVVSKYIGETEKNLSRIFAEARSSNAILFFDEADALFGKRSEVRDAHDRYANIETAYLLQKMEEYDGIVILATNFRKNMDEAFVRRLHFIVEFPFPKADERRRIWERIWPETAPRSPDLDLEFLAQRIEVAGGSIRNIALASAFLAAADNGAIQMKHLLQATQREYRKMGKVLTEDELVEDPTPAARRPK